MKNKTILPVELVELTYEHYFGRMGARSQFVYLAVLLFIALVFAAMFVVKADVIVKGSGMLTAADERSWIKTPVSGRVAVVFAKENQPVKKGQVLFTMESAILEEEFSYLRERKRKLIRQEGDLRQLLTICREKSLELPVSLASPLYIQQFGLLKQEVRRAANQLQNAAAVFKRNEYLFKSQVLAAAEFDKYRYALEAARSGLQLVYEEQGGRWQAALNELNSEMRELVLRENKLNKEKEYYTIRAPAGGIVQQLQGVQEGSFFSQGEQVAQLSPDSGLLARILIPPADIGLLEEGMPVRLQVDAFNYQQWGMITGTVSDISEDVLLTQDRRPFFEVKCKLKKTALMLSNGYPGKLKRGMTLQARFLVTERTLFQLLHDNVDDWLDPYAQNKG
ncbi:HlyD family secretion protein [Anseongella ginsenosidimutans]|uniref:HlyD family secretion protein n=1 Tax=Anseongella ginsenosidimutans TaxID=496056 RepID=A0A4R3KX11_9SPHI|nr:HlyD family efflux transporter periplasmic adaptor subunit [Anseongella ginsenosidimutans]QEC51359.1 HlyD family efflux transporter periplasmic adaptor subunit [Anseongella ginsenosidimutans]TCS89941.1 HlyD family secretion protein [Anseongella ginsenosidimutans]